MKRIGLYPRVRADRGGVGVVSQAGGVALVEAVRVAGLDRALSTVLARWRKPMAIHDRAKVVCDLAVALAIGGDCLADVALLACRARGVRAGGFGPDGVAHDRRVGC